ncbi:hypothetical protein N0V90_006460 [Kalmusia sp. IMI 367209]|nr:hypothetical protein N0V90_006460 [Kalmusia sp. IMI 367209]
MRLLRRTSPGEFSFTEDVVGNDEVPPYAILSHTWSLNTKDEVTFEEISNGTGKDKKGYEKVRFCGEQAAQDGLEYFWIDTCCINKEDKAELSYAINSMFRWYRNAARCYVYLSDVSTTSITSNRKKKLTKYVPRPLNWTKKVGASSENANATHWESDFRKSKWFTRGWTLQELLGPVSVVFFSQERRRLGDKGSLEQILHEITGIPKAALQGAHLSQFSVKDRFQWIGSRQTKLEEDKAYSLLGIFDVDIPLRYGEGMVNAFKRLEEEIDNLSACLRDLRLTDPHDNKKRIEETKGGLLKESYYWILENSGYQQWCDDQQSRLLWVKGDAGKGKTMLLCGIIDQLKLSMAQRATLSYFLCQATDSQTNNATAILRGLLYMLVKQLPSLITHVRKKYDYAGKDLFEDVNAWVAIHEIFTNVLQDPKLNGTYLIIDALDECIVDLQKLLDFIIHVSSVSPRIKWIVSSRNLPGIEKTLDTTTHSVRLCLELNEESVSAAIRTYISFQVNRLAKRNRYDNETRDVVERYLSSNAKGTFLWVALVCQELANTPAWRAQMRVKVFPPGLNAVYRRMLDQICSSEDADLCKRILAVISAVYEPISLDELVSFVDMPTGISGNDEALLEIIGLCGSFLTLRNRTIFFVHQSAKDFLLREALYEICPFGIEDIHRSIFLNSLQIMSKTLRRDIYSLGSLGYPIERVRRPDPDPLAASRYLCIYWIDHFHDWKTSSPTDNTVELEDRNAIETFLREKYLYWLEALSLCKSMPKGVISLANLEALFNSLFKKEEPKWITVKPAIGEEWGVCIQTLEEHRCSVDSVAFSHDSLWLISVAMDSTVKLWDVSSGACLQTLEGHRDIISDGLLARLGPTCRRVKRRHNRALGYWQW